MKRKKIVPALLTVAIVAGGLVYLLVAGFDDTVVYYKTVDELLAEPARFESRPVRINGVLVSGSVKSKLGTDEYRFQLTKRQQVVDVTYSGILPDTMREGQELVVQGMYNPARRTFDASEILTKCPSKYEAQAKAIE